MVLRSVVHAFVEGAFTNSPLQYGFIKTVFVLLTVLLGAKLFLQRLKFLRSIKWIPGPLALPLVGNALTLAISQDGKCPPNKPEITLKLDLFRLLLSYGAKYGRVFRLWVGTRPYVVLTRAEDIQPILTSVEHIDKSYEYSYLKDWLGEGLIITSGAKWQKRRKLLTPTFHRDLVSDTTDAIGPQVELLLDILSRYERNGTVFNVMPELKHCTLDIICVTAMGVEAGAQKKLNQNYVKAVEKLSSVIQKRFFSPWLQPEFLFKRSTYGKAQEESVSIVNAFVTKVIDEKRLEKENRHLDDGSIKRSKVFLDLLLDANANGADFTAQDLRDEVQTFMFAGHDSTACALGWALFLLGKHPDLQEKIVQEAKNAEMAGTPFFKQLQTLAYLEMCIKEVMRLYPIAPIIARDIRKPVKLSCGEMIPSGVTALINLPLLHRDPRHFPDPEQFKPERFATSFNRHPFSYIPFSAGPRNCIGQRFAQMTTKHILLRILQRFRVTSIDPEEELKLITKLVLINKEGIRLSLQPR